MCVFRMSLIKSPSLTITGPFGSCWEMRHLSWHCRGIKDKNKGGLTKITLKAVHLKTKYTFARNVYVCHFKYALFLGQHSL